MGYLSIQGWVRSALDSRLLPVPSAQLPHPSTGGLSRPENIYVHTVYEIYCMPLYRTQLCIMRGPLCMCDLSAYSCVGIYTRPWCAVYGTQYCMSVYVHGVGVRYRGLPLCIMPASCRGLSAFVTCQPYCMRARPHCVRRAVIRQLCRHSHVPLACCVWYTQYCMCCTRS